jgi:hypothetical protein
MSPSRSCATVGMFARSCAGATASLCRRGERRRVGSLARKPDERHSAARRWLFTGALIRAGNRRPSTRSTWRGRARRAPQPQPRGQARPRVESGRWREGTPDASLGVGRSFAGECLRPEQAGGRRSGEGHRSAPVDHPPAVCCAALRPRLSSALQDGLARLFLVPSGPNTSFTLIHIADLTLRPACRRVDGRRGRDDVCRHPTLRPARTFSEPLPPRSRVRSGLDTCPPALLAAAAKATCPGKSE